MNSKKLARGAITLVTSTIFAWIGAALDHGNWWGWASSVLGIIGLFVGYGIARLIDDWVEGP